MFDKQTNYLNFITLLIPFEMFFQNSLFREFVKMVFSFLSQKNGKIYFLVRGHKVSDLNTILDNFSSSTMNQLWKQILGKSQCLSKTFMVLVLYDFSSFYQRGRDMGVGVVNWSLKGLVRSLSSRSFLLFLFTVFVSHCWIERFSNDCRKTKTKVITLTNHNRNKQRHEPIRIPSNYL